MGIEIITSLPFSRRVAKRIIMAGEVPEVTRM